MYGFTLGDVMGEFVVPSRSGVWWPVDTGAYERFLIWRVYRESKAFREKGFQMRLSSVFN